MVSCMKNTLFRCAAVAILLGLCAFGGAEPLKVVCTTTLMGSAVDAAAADTVRSRTIVPFGMCPGHFDLTPGEAQSLREAELLLCHGFERFVQGVDFGDATDVVQAGVPGNWMIPEVYTQAVLRVADILAQKRPELQAELRRRGARHLKELQKAADDVRSRLKPYRETPVIASNMNRAWIEWCGLRVVAEFPRDEDISVKQLHDIIKQGLSAGAAVIADNRQSSGKVGQTIARELGVPYTLLSNFPEASSMEAYLQALQQNGRMLADALKERGASDRRP